MLRIADVHQEAFSAEAIDALLVAVDIDDVVDPMVSLPDPILPACTQAEIDRCFALCLRFWELGVRRTDLLRLVNTLLQYGDLDSAERGEYKQIRAKYKHLRFALALYGARHKAPLVFRVTVAIMGHLQDAFRHRRRRAVLVQAMLLRMLLAKPVWAFVERKLGGIRLDTSEGFAIYRKSEIRALETVLRQEHFTGHQFHAIRKIVSRHVSFYDTLRSLEPSDHAFKMSRFLSAVNGLMGSRHDEMIEQAISKQRDYRSAAPLCTDIRQRLEALIVRYPLEDCA